MSQSPWTCLEGTPHQIEVGQGKAKARVGGTPPNSRKTPNKANRTPSESATTVTSLGTLPENAEHPSKLETDKHKYRTIWTKIRTSHTFSRKYTLPTC